MRPKNTQRNSKPILEREYKILKSYINGLETFETTKIKWLRSLEILYMGGMRVSEILDIKIKDIKDGIEKSVKVLKKLIENETDINGYFIHKRNNVRNNLNSIGFTKDFNQLIQIVLGKNYSTHSFRKGIITEMGVSGINPKIIQHFVSHKNISTTLNYINPTSDDIRNSLLR